MEVCIVKLLTGSYLSGFGDIIRLSHFCFLLHSAAMSDSQYYAICLPFNVLLCLSTTPRLRVIFVQTTYSHVHRSWASKFHVNTIPAAATILDTSANETLLAVVPHRFLDRKPCVAARPLIARRLTQQPDHFAHRGVAGPRHQFASSS